VLSG
jgi:hypothetical protein